MRPFELRLKAIKNIKDAETLIDSSPDNAFYLAGYSIEFILKARLCTTRDWPRLPSNNAEKKEWNRRDGRSQNEKVFIHDLQDLLTLSNTISIKSNSFNRINWEQTCSWTEQTRYKPIDSVTNQEAKEYVAEVRKVVEILMEYELVQVLLKKEKDVCERYGAFHCFVLLKNPKDKLWTLLMSWCSPTQELQDLRAEEIMAFFESMDEDLRGMIGNIVFEKIDRPAIKSAMAQAAMIGGVQHRPSAYFSNNIVVGLPKLHPGYFITAGNWSIEFLQKEWKRAKEYRESLKDIAD